MRFSVIIPLYNKAPYVHRALESVLRQSYHDFELIVIDDGSTDHSYEVASSALQASSIPFQLIHQANAGVSTARNNGVAVSSGEYLCFLDADDWWEWSFLEKMDALIRDFPDAGIYGTNYYIVKGERKRIGALVDASGYINYCDSYRDTHMPLTSISVAIPRQVFLEESGFKPWLRLGEDFDLWIRIALKNKVAFLNEPLAYYYQDSNPQWRGTGHMTDPSHHMLWNLSYLEEYERTNPDYKRLIDDIRTYSLFPYYLSSQYRSAAKTELNKVDWSKQSRQLRLLYSLPIPFLKLRQKALSIGSRIKQSVLNHL